MRQVGYLQGLYRYARSAKHKKNNEILFIFLSKIRVSANVEHKSVCKFPYVNQVLIKLHSSEIRILA